MAESVKASVAIGKKVLRPREQVEDQIKAAILSGALRPGDRLPGEVELARQFAVSRTTVREALRSLSTQNLITKTPGAGGGSFVRSIDLSSLRRALGDSVHNLLALGSIEFDEVAIVRQHLEVPAVRLAAVNRTTEDLVELRDIVALQKSISVEDPRVPALDEQFHGAIARASGNRVLASFVSALHLETEPVHYLDLSPEVGRTTVRQHQRIVRAIGEQNPDAGEEAIIEHLTYLREHILAYRQR
ncbi:DNA-binding transcriptional regulator, FadR family [Modestobacter sp. DSM 44400]|nr:DNA-binding transcriptional regulator, FadR family [Modestobacter sp. DSM 44400]